MSRDMGKAAAIALLGFAAAASPAAAAPAAPSSADAIADRFVDEGKVPNVYTIVERNGKVKRHFHGWTNIEQQTPVRRDSIFRWASMTKPITAVAVMILIEDGKLSLDAPVDKWLPELANRRVLTSETGPLDETYPSPRPITVEDLLTYRTGYASAMMYPDSPYKTAISQLDTGAAGSGAITPDEWIARLGDIPLTVAPGTRWQYNMPSEIMGVLVARASGMPFEAFLEERIFKPLKMVDTGFWVPAEKRERLVESYVAGPDGKLRAFHIPYFATDKAPTRPSGAGGLVGTPDDYLRFARMLMNGGELDGIRILKADTVARMTRNYLTPEQLAYNPPEAGMGGSLWTDKGFGLGVSVRMTTGPGQPAAGTYGWPGAFGTEWLNDPANRTITLLFTQRLAAGQQTTLYKDWMAAIYDGKPALGK